MPTKKLKFLLKDSLLRTLENSIGTKLFRNSFYIIGGKREDILGNGRLSCAIFVSSILYIFKLIRDVHATVDGTIRDLEASDWRRVRSPRPGDVLIWEPLRFADGSEHGHIGFYIGSNMAVSNSLRQGCPAKHHYTYGIKKGRPARKIIAIYRSRKLK